MHPDRKIGFALGILLVGIVAALFFRNEPMNSSTISSLPREGELNRRLRERDVAVFLDETNASELDGGEQGDPDSAWTHSELVEDLARRNSFMASPIAGTPRALPMTGSEPVDDFQRPLPPFTTTDDAAQDNDVADSEEATKQTPTLAESIAELAERTRRTGPAPPSTSPDGPTASEDSPRAYDEYVVEYGDTLSDIAERFLGSPNRYSEIYEANRDRISAPDQLRVGKALRIPRF